MDRCGEHRRCHIRVGYCACDAPPRDENEVFASVMAGSIVFGGLYLVLTVVVLVACWGQPDYDHIWLIPGFMTATMFGMGPVSLIVRCRQR